MGDTSKCILISLDDEVSELKNLALSLGFIVDKIFIQKREKPSSKYYIGKGKIEEVKDYTNQNRVDIAIFNSLLKPSQQFNLENYLEISVYDRIRLILEIFKTRAYSEEARLQVELAKLQYEIPLLRDWIHKARYGEKPGFMAGGEYEVAQYYEISRKRIKKIKQKLKKIEKERDIRRKQRRDLGYYLVSIVGYTNAGKSTLFNLISGESINVENRLFTTLSTTTRKIPKLKKPILITDTVGLIDDLPHWIIDAFHSTLEEIYLSDLILLIVDINETVEEVNRKLKTSFDVLLPDINPSDIILILNKIDKISDNTYEDIEINKNKMSNMKDMVEDILDNIELEYEVENIISISAQDQKYEDIVIGSILKCFEYPIQLSIKLPNKPESQNFINWLYSNVEMLSIKYEDKIEISLKCRARDESYVIDKSHQINDRN
ncbi:MAG: GTPase HflX [Thermoplasmata archaeon]|nr:MAG: GTPase HflX [Thermoplasmata archaeon]